MLLDSHILEKFYKLLEDHKTPQEIHHIKEDIEFRLKTFNVVLLGEYSGGKSSFLNFLLDFDESFGELPFGVLPETKCFWKIRKYDEEGDKNYKSQFEEKQHILRLYRKNGGVVTRYSLVDVSIKKRKENEDLKNILSEISEVELIVKNEFIPNVNINIWDAPGTGDATADKTQEDETIQKINKSNLCIVVGHARKICTKSFVETLKKCSPDVKLVFIVRPESNDEVDFLDRKNHLKILKQVMHGESKNDETSLIADCYKIKAELEKENIKFCEFFPVQIKNEIAFRKFKKDNPKKSFPKQYDEYLGGQKVKNYIFKIFKKSNKHIKTDVITQINIILDEIVEKIKKEIKEYGDIIQKKYVSIEGSIKELTCPQINVEYKKNALIEKIDELEKTPCFRRNWVSDTPYVVEKLIEYINKYNKFKNFFDGLKGDIDSEFCRIILSEKDKNIQAKLTEILKIELKKFDVKLCRLFKSNCELNYNKTHRRWLERNIQKEISSKQKEAGEFLGGLKGKLIENLDKEYRLLFIKNENKKQRCITQIENFKKDINK